MISNNVEIAKEIVTRELLDFRRFHVDVKNIKNLFCRDLNLEFATKVRACKGGS
jgi:hypothetical protein